MDDGSEHQQLLSLTTEIVAAFASNNTVATSDLPALISSVFQALRAAGTVEVAQAVAAPTPAVAIRKSVTPEFIICLEDGKKMKMLKRYLARRYDMTPDDYRRRWGLPDSYPMVAPAYAAQRSALAKSIGLGRKPTEAALEPEPEAAAVETKPARRPAVGRKLPKAAGKALSR